MTSAVDVANMALDNIGARFSITSIDPPAPAGPNAILVARHYQPKIDALHRAAHWNCTRRQTTLTLLRAARGTPENPSGTTLPIPPIPWQYEYGYPATCLKARYLLADDPQNGTTLRVLGGGVGVPPQLLTNPGYPFAIGISTDSQGNEIKVIWTDLEFAQLVYTARIVNPDLWDPHFLMAACATLGAWLVNPLNSNAEMLKNQIAIATSIIQQARVSDGNEGMTTIDHVPDWMAVRGVSALDATGPRPFYGWDAIGFPGGLLI